MSKLIVGAIQMQSGDDKEANLLRAEAFINVAVEGGAKLIALPELFNFCGAPQFYLQNSETILDLR